MDDIIIQKNKKIKYIFSDDAITVKKRDVAVRRVLWRDIQRIEYYPKTQIKDILMHIFFAKYYAYNDSLVAIANRFYICMKSARAGKSRIIKLKIKPNDFDRIKETFRLSVLPLS